LFFYMIAYYCLDVNAWMNFEQKISVSLDLLSFSTLSISTLSTFTLSIST